MSFPFALGRRWHQPTGLAVALAPLALLACCAQPVQALASAEQIRSQTLSIVQHGGDRAGDSSAGQLQAVKATGAAADKAACCVPRAAWPVGKSQPARRITERWAPGPLGAFAFGDRKSVV